MAFTEVFKAASPIRGGYPVGAIAGGTWGATGSGGVATVSTTLASCMFVMLTPYGGVNATLTSAYPAVGTISGGMFDIATGASCSGSWLAFGY